MTRTPPRSSAGRPRHEGHEQRLSDLEQTVEALQRESAIQLQRIAQLQAELDAIRHAWFPIKGAPV